MHWRWSACNGSIAQNRPLQRRRRPAPRPDGRRALRAAGADARRPRRAGAGRLGRARGHGRAGARRAAHEEAAAQAQEGRGRGQGGRGARERARRARGARARRGARRGRAAAAAALGAGALAAVCAQVPRARGAQGPAPRRRGGGQGGRRARECRARPDPAPARAAHLQLQRAQAAALESQDAARRHRGQRRRGAPRALGGAGRNHGHVRDHPPAGGAGQCQEARGGRHHLPRAAQPRHGKGQVLVLRALHPGGRGRPRAGVGPDRHARRVCQAGDRHRGVHHVDARQEPRRRHRGAARLLPADAARPRQSRGRQPAALCGDERAPAAREPQAGPRPAAAGAAAGLRRAGARLRRVFEAPHLGAARGRAAARG